MNGRSDRKTRRGKKQAKKKSRGPKRLGWRRQETVQLLIEGTNPKELHEAVDVAVKELSRPMRLRFPSPAEARAGKYIVTAMGSDPGITLELSPGLVLGDRPGRYGFGLQRRYVIDRQDKPPIIAQMLKPLGRPRGTGRRKRAPGAGRALVEKLYLTSRASTVARWLQQRGLTQAQSEVLTRRLVDHQLQRQIAGERGVSIPAVSAILQRACDKLFQACKANPKLSDQLMPYFAPQAETTKRPGD